MKKLNKILLIDDSESDNFIHSRIIRKCDVTREIKVCYSAEDGLAYLQNTVEKDGDLPPELIFLDINMPGMNGWEFLEEYDRLDIKYKARIIITMLTTSLNPDDNDRALKNAKIQKFMTKPLTREMLMTTLREHFPDHFPESI